MRRYPEGLLALLEKSAAVSKSKEDGREAYLQGKHAAAMGRGLHSSTFQLNLSRFRHKIHPEHPLMPPNTS